jgi:c-di-GMP-binding flagellar brake protein YcgR
VAFRQLDKRQTLEVLTEVAAEQVPLAVTIRAHSRWVSLRSRLLAVEDEVFWIAPPIEPGSTAPYQLSDIEKLGVSFRVEPHKYTFVARREAAGRYDGQPALSLRIPSSINVIDRRMYPRVMVPEGTARASFWPGGREAEPAGMTPDRPIWSGSLVDISVSGFQVRASADAARFLEPGDIVGVRFLFGLEEEPVYINAQFRRATFENNVANMGFQFAGVEQSLETMASLEIVVDKIDAFQKKGDLRKAIPGGV